MLLSLAQQVVRTARRAKNRLLNAIDPPVVVLLYHRVTTLPTDPQLLAVSPDNFRAHLHHLKHSFPIVRFEDDWAKAPKPAVVITFDDGYADNAREALPILEELEVPATFFVSTGTLDTRQEFWWDELERIILGDGPFPARFSLDSTTVREWPTASPGQRQTLYEELHPLLKKLDARDRENRLRQVRSWAQTGDEGREAWRPLSREELRRLAGSGWVTIGAHTVTHTALSALPIEEQRQEIMGSRKSLEAVAGREVTVFSYPFGTRKDYTPHSVTLCREVGFTRVAANFPGQAHTWTDPCQIPRQLVRNWDLATFRQRMNDFWVL